MKLKVMMMKNIASYISAVLSQQGIIKAEDDAVFKYGLEAFAMSVLEILSVLILSLFLSSFIETLMFFVAFVPFRMYAGGYHAETKLRCYLVLLAVYAIFILLIGYMPAKYIMPVEICSMVLTAVMVFTSAPIVNKNKRASENERRVYRKISIVLMLVEFGIIILGMVILPGNIIFFSFSLGQSAVTSSMVAAALQKKIAGGDTNEKI